MSPSFYDIVEEPEDAPSEICPKCFMEIPKNGECCDL